MAAKPRRRKRGGVLTQLGKVPHAKKKKKRLPEGPLGRALRWLGYIAGGLVGVGLVFAFVSLMFNPNLGAREGEAVVRVEEVAAGGAAADSGEIVVVTLENRKVRISVPPDEAAPVPGEQLRVQYMYFPRTGIVRVDRWEPVPDEPRDAPAP